jgi:hypothetical protein
MQGTYRRGLDGHYSWEINGGCYSGDRFQKQREREKIVGGGRWHAGSTCQRREEGMPVPFRDGALLGLGPNLGLG